MIVIQCEMNKLMHKNRNIYNAQKCCGILQRSIQKIAKIYRETVMKYKEYEEKYIEIQEFIEHMRYLWKYNIETRRYIALIQ